MRAAHIIDTHEILRRSQAEHPEKYLVEILGQDFWVYPGVFPSGYFNDTDFFAEHLLIDEGDDVLEIGPGIGAISIVAAQKGAASVTGIDISLLAVQNSIDNAKLHHVEGKTRFVEGDVYSPLTEGEKFDKIFWNVPFGFVTVPITIFERSVFDQNYAAIERFIKEARQYLNSGGKLLIGFSSIMGDFDRLKQFLDEAGVSSVQRVVQKMQSEGRKQPLTFEIFEVSFDVES